MESTGARPRSHRRFCRDSGLISDGQLKEWLSNGPGLRRACCVQSRAVPGGTGRWLEAARRIRYGRGHEFLPGRLPASSNASCPRPITARARRHAARYDRAALHRHAERPRRAAAAVRSGERGCPRIISCSRTARSCRWCRRPARAWHAGVSFWAGDTDINSRSIGIEIANPGHDFGYPDFPERQIAAVITLCRGILARHIIPRENVVAHSDVAPSRKQDPGEKFPWTQLYESGVGLWVEARADHRGRRAGRSSSATAATPSPNCRSSWPNTATASPTTGDYDAATKEVVTAFQRHFRPARVDGMADASTRRRCARCSPPARRCRRRQLQAASGP